MAEMLGHIVRAVPITLLVIAATLSAATPATAERRVALVIGNAAYIEAGRLANALNDAREVGAALRRLDFDVTSAEDLVGPRFREVVSGFAAKARGADVALFFYAGHALQLRDTNYLMPVDARLATELDVKSETIAAQDIVELMESSARVSLVFLDACRNNPLSERLRRNLAASGRGAAIGRGLGRIDAKGRDTLIVFSAEAGAEALDTAGGANSPFTAGLLASIETPGLEIEAMLKHVTRAVRDATGGKQQPERLSRLESVFYFKPGVADLPIANAPAPAPQSEAERAWGRIELTEDRATLEAFVRQFPDTVYTAMATQRLSMLASQPEPVPPVAPPPPTASEPTSLATGLNAAQPRADQSETVTRPAMMPGQTFRDCPECPEMVMVPAGSFVMGTPESEEGRRENEGPQHTVTFSKPFAVAKFEVTRREYDTFVRETRRKLGGCLTHEKGEYKLRVARSYRDPAFVQTDTHPAVCINRDDTEAFVAWLSVKSGKPYRLLTESEWEYAARAGTTTRYSFGNDTKDVCAYGNGAADIAKAGSAVPPRDSSVGCQDSHPYTAPVGSYKPNAFGLYDMHGNALEWVEDCYRRTYVGAPTDGSALIVGDCTYRVARGGAWFFFSSTMRSAGRFDVHVGDRIDYVGLRVARSLD